MALPGTPQPSPPSPRTSAIPGQDIFLLLLACACLWGWTYGRWDLWGPDEPRYVQIAKELLTRSNWLVLTVNGKPYAEKPPLPFWMIAGMLKLSGGVVSSWAVRLPAVLFGTLTVLLTYLIGLRRFGRRVGWLAGWVLLTSALFVFDTPAARLDIPLTGLIALALWAWLARPPAAPLGWGRVILFWLGLIGAFFIKGPVVLVIVWGTIGLEAWRARSWRPALELRPQFGLPFLIALVGAWQWAEKALVSAEFVRQQQATATINRLFNPELHREPFYFFLGVLFGDSFMPWALLLALALVWLWRVRKRPAEFPADWAALRPVLIWAVWPFLFLSLVPTKREQYLLPMFPALALLTAWYLDRRWLAQPVAPWLRRLGAGLCTLAGGALLAGVLALKLKPGLLAQQGLIPQPSLLLAATLLGALLLAAGWMWRKTSTGKRAIVLIIFPLYLTGVVVMAAVHPAINPIKSPRAISQAVQARLIGAQCSVGALGKTFKPQYQVYGSYQMVDLDETTSSLPSVILATPKDWKKLAPRLTPHVYTKGYESRKQSDSIGVYARQEPTPPLH